MRTCWARRAKSTARDLEIYHPARTAAGQGGHRGRRVSAKASATGLLVENMSFQPAARRHCRRHRPERRRQDHPVQNDHRPGDSPTPARSGSGETVKLAYVDQSRDVLDPDKTIWEVISDGQDTHPAGQPGGQLPGLRRPVQFLRHRPAEKGRACSPAASATGSTWPGC